MKKLLVANYKMNGNKNFYQKVNKVINKLKIADTVVLCPPFVYMPFFKIKNKNLFLGSQDVSCLENKTSTGQISSKMLKEFDVKYAIVGHSERRALGESDEQVALKVKQAKDNGIMPIVCVGEKNKSSKISVVKNQVEIALSNIESGEVVFAYEPIWAIGSGEVPTIKKIDSVINLIKETAQNKGFHVKVLYGGSVNEKNHQELKTSLADGFLMGGVSLKLDEFISIIKGD